MFLSSYKTLPPSRRPLSSAPATQSSWAFGESSLPAGRPAASPCRAACLERGHLIALVAAAGRKISLRLMVQNVIHVPLRRRERRAALLIIGRLFSRLRRAIRVSKVQLRRFRGLNADSLGASAMNNGHLVSSSHWQAGSAQGGPLSVGAGAPPPSVTQRRAAANQVV